MDELLVEGRKPSIAVRIALIVAGLGLVFGAVLAVELATGNKTATTLPRSPHPLIPAAIDRYGLSPATSLADALRTGYERAGIGVSAVEAASVTRRDDVLGTVVAARLTIASAAGSPSFRAGVLAGAAGGFQIDLKRAPFILQHRSRLDVYATSVEEGRLTVWFFRDAFCQLFVDAQNASDAPAILDRIISAQLAAIGPSPS